MFSSQAKGERSLDDSLTNIQWLCELESSELLQSQRASKLKEVAEGSQSHVPPSSPNPHPKPPYSYATMILIAINSTEDKRMTLQDIYKWIENNYPYYKKCKKAWKNSIRHNLSLHSFFLKEKRPVDLPGKGSYWSISPEGKKNIMREVMKHAQPVIQNPLIQTDMSFCSRNLRPILPKPSDDVHHPYNAGFQHTQKMPGVCSIVNGNTVMPVVILPTDVYMNLASKIANNKKESSGFAVTQGSDATIKVTGDEVIPPNHAETKTSRSNQGSGNVSVTDLMDEILKNKSFSEVLDTIKTENENNSLKVDSTSMEFCNQHYSCGGTQMVVVKQEKKDDSNFGPPFKKNKIEATEENLHKKPSLPCPVLQTMSNQHRSPLKDRTLAMMNSENNDSFMEYKPQDMASSLLSPVQLNTPRASSITSKKSSTPAQSSPLSSAFRSGLTPLKYDSDSGFFTPLQDSDFDFLLSPSQLNLQISPTRLVSPHGCRKSLRLGTVQEDTNRNDVFSWM